MPLMLISLRYAPPTGGDRSELDGKNHFRIVLRTPGLVPIDTTHNLLACDAALDQSRTGVSEELRSAAQALLDQVQPHLNFDQGDVALFVMDMPDVPPQHAQVVIAQASAAQEGEAKTDRTIGVCHVIENPPDPPGTAVNALSPLGSVSDHFWKGEHLGVGLNGKVILLEGPKHGTLGDAGDGDYVYRPTPDYYGPDRATLLVKSGKSPSTPTTPIPRSTRNYPADGRAPSPTPPESLLISPISQAAP